MRIAWIAGLTILVVLMGLLLAGIPIAIALAVSSICAILPVLEMEPALVTGAQRIFSGISVFNLIAIPFFYSGGKSYEPGRYCHTADPVCQAVYGKDSGSFGSH